MSISPSTWQIFGLTQCASIVLPVLKLFLLPVGGGIPAGVLLARANGMIWPVTTAIYLASDLVLILALEPVLRFLAILCSKLAFLDRVGASVKTALARGQRHFGGRSAGPLSLVALSFGVDPMTGRAAALAAGHGFVAGWGFAIAGDMLYFGVIALTTLRLNAYFRDPDATMPVVLVAMFAVPMIVRYFRARKGARCVLS